MDYTEKDATVYDEKYWEKKVYIDNIDLDRRIFIAEDKTHINAVLYDKYEKLRRLELNQIDHNNISATFMPELLPNSLMGTVNQIASLTKYDSEPVLLATLGNIASALCGRYCVQVEEGRTEAGCLYTVISAPPGSKQSTLIDSLREPFDKHFAKLGEEFEEQIAKFENTGKPLTLLKNKVSTKVAAIHVKNTCEGGIYVGDPLSYLSALKCSTEDFDQIIDATKPKYETRPQFYWSNTRKASAEEIMSRQGEFSCVLDKDGTFFENEICSRSAYDELYFKSYNMDSYYPRSKYAGKEPMKRPAMCVTTFVQIDTLMRWYKDSKRRGRELHATFLPFFTSMPFLTHKYTSLPTPPSAGAMLTYNDKISEMLNRNYTHDKSRKIWIVTLSPEAYKLIKEYESLIKPFIAEPDLAHISTFLSMADGSAVRLALCIHAWNYSEPEKYPITHEEMKAAISLMDLIIMHANIAFAPDLIQAITDAQSILNWIGRCDWTARPVFSENDAKNAISNLSMDRCRAALNLLEKCNYIMQYHKVGIHRQCVLNPRLVEQNFSPLNTFVRRF
jgi:hypothetical protein